MFDIGWSELLIIGVMALIVVGPKDLPALLRTLGRYIGIIRRQASEFRTQFDDVLRETEIDQIRKDVAAIKNDVSSSMREAGKQVEREMEAGKVDLSGKDILASKTAALNDAEDFNNDASNLIDDPFEVPVEKPVAKAGQADVALTAEPEPLVQGSNEKSGA